MKRAKPKKRRARRSGESPYVKYGKRETQYSSAYNEWKRSIVGKAARQGDRHHRAQAKQGLEHLAV